MSAKGPSGTQSEYVPKCPTCGSPDVEREELNRTAALIPIVAISYMFKKKWLCHNCHYRYEILAVQDAIARKGLRAACSEKAY